MAPVRHAVIGAGVIGRRHIDLIGASRSCVLAAIVDSDPRARELAEAVGVPWRETAEAMFETDRPEGVIVATPTGNHLEMGLLCVEARVATLMEKPVAATVEEARILIEAAEAADVPVAVGQHRRFNPTIERTREIVRSGELGRLVAFHVVWLALKHAEYFDVDWHVQAGGGPVLTNLIHDIDCLRWIAGEVEEVSAHTSSQTRGHAVEDTAAMALRLAGGAIGTIILSDATPSPWSYEMTMRENADFYQVEENSFHFMGSDASLAVPEMRLWRYQGANTSGWQHPLASETRPHMPGYAYGLQIEHFARVARGEEAPRTSARDGAATLAATLAVHEAARRGRSVQPLEI